MIKVEKIDFWGFEHAIRGMRNPFNSWDKSDSEIIPWDESSSEFGKNDLGLMKRLFNAGTEHRKYLRQIMVSMDITAPLYWWKEFDTYKVGTVANSCSTMHTVHKKDFTEDDFSCEHLTDNNKKWWLNETINALNKARKEYLSDASKESWWQLIQMLPSSYNQKRTVTMNYENVVTIIKQRSNHRLDEWNDLIKELKTLPCIKELIDEDNDDLDIKSVDKD
jgi:hypothetical protein